MWYPGVRCLAGGCAIALAVSGCTTRRLVEPPQTATEQLLITTAVDHAVAGLSPVVPPGSLVFLDPQFVDTAPIEAVLYSKYLIGSVRDLLLKAGARLAEERKDAEIIVELRSGAQSIDHNSFLLGIPSFELPVPLSSTPVSTPEVALFKRDHQIGAAKVAVTAYRRTDGTLVGSAGPTLGYSERRKTVILLFISWTDTDAPSPEDHDQQK